MDLKRLSMLVGVVLSVAAQGRLAAAGRWPREASVGLVAVVPAESNYPKLSSWRCTRQSPCEHDPERERERAAAVSPAFSLTIGSFEIFLNFRAF